MGLEPRPDRADGKDVVDVQMVSGLPFDLRVPAPEKETGIGLDVGGDPEQLLLIVLREVALDDDYHGMKVTGDCQAGNGACTIGLVMRIWLSAVLAVFVLVPGAEAQQKPRAMVDIVTMIDGEIHHGTVALEGLVIEAPYGTVSVPFARILRVQAAGDAGHHLFTTEGERFTGRLRHDSVPILRVLEAPLELSPAEVADIEFAPRGTRMALVPAADVMEMQNGDVFRARIDGAHFLVTAEGSLTLVERRTVHIIDVVNDGVLAQVRVTFNSSGRSLTGVLASSGIPVVLRHGQSLTLNPVHMATLGLRVMQPGKMHVGALEFTFRRRAGPWDVVRDRLRDDSLGPEMVRVRGGAFKRGDINGSGDVDEQPPRDIMLSKPFAIGLYEVTFDDYDRYCRATNCLAPEDEGWGRGRRPVINVSWAEAVEYTRWLSEQTGHTYRLPSDAEWEYAARSGTGSRFWWGDTPGEARANCAECLSLWDAEKTARVGKFPPNPFGLHDTAGNVFEWVADCWHDTFVDAPADGSAIEKEGCGKRVIRGGAWSFPPTEMRSANRWRDFPSRSSDDTGFRLVRELD